MDETVEDRACRAALDEWDKQKVRRLVVGLLATDRPLLSPASSPFYVATLGCEASDENRRFCDTYNAVIDSLLRERGMPVWSPAARLPDRRAALEMLVNGQDIAKLVPEKLPYEKRLLDSLMARWQMSDTRKPAVWCRDRDRGVLAVGGDWTAKVGKVEVIDLIEMRWMASYEYLRKHLPHLPWDANADGGKVDA